MVLLWCRLRYVSKLTFASLSSIFFFLTYCLPCVLVRTSISIIFELCSQSSSISFHSLVLMILQYMRMYRCEKRASYKLLSGSLKICSKAKLFPLTHAISKDRNHNVCMFHTHTHTRYTYEIQLYRNMSISLWVVLEGIMSFK